MVSIPVAKPYLTRDEAKAAYNIILSGWVTQGPRVKEFEDKFAKYVDAKYAVAVSSCTTALHLALIVAGVKKGDEVICPSLSFIATANSIIYAGAKPVFCDIDPETNNIDPEKAEKLITKKTKAILIVHQIGYPADIDAFKIICRKHKLILIEDAACAVGSSYKNKKIGSHSSLVCFSFHPRKVITTGDGGMITTSNQKYNEQLRLLRQHGMSINDQERHNSKKVLTEHYMEIGYNYRMTDIQAGIGIEQLKKIDWLVEERRRIAKIYNDHFKGVPYFRILKENHDVITNYQSYSIYLKKNCPVSRNTLMQRLLNMGVSTRRGIMVAHLEKPYRKIYPKLKLPISEDLSENSILLPLYVPMKNHDINYVIKTILNLLQ